MVRRAPRNAQEDQGGFGQTGSSSEYSWQNDVEFVLRMQDFIELCRKRDISTAIVYARKNLAPWAPTHMAEIQHLMALLSFGEKTGVKLYRVSRQHISAAEDSYI